MNNYYVYFYIDPRNEEVFYIGKGKHNRCYDHLNRVKRGIIDEYNNEKSEKIKDILNENKTPIIKKIHKNLCEEKSYDLEKYYIKKIGRKDLNEGTLLNRTDGGEGPSIGTYTKEIKEKISKKNIERWNNKTKIEQQEYIKNSLGNFFDNLTEIELEDFYIQRGKSMKKNWDENPERKIKFSENFKGEKNPFYGKTHTDEVKKIIINANKGKKLSVETKNKMSDNWNKRKNIIESRATLKKWLIIDPEGIEYKIIGGFKTFCEEHNIKTPSLLREVANNKRDNYKGWKAFYRS